MKAKQQCSTSNTQRSQTISRNTSKKNTSSQFQSKAAQLFQIIQTFHNTLCGLPLDTLVSNQNPERWIEQQCHTLQQLLAKIQNYTDHNQYQYYNAKLDSVRRILSNISENIKMLMKMKINNYNSNTSIATSRMSLESTERKLQNRQQNSNLEDLANGLLSIDNYQLSNKSKQSRTKAEEHFPICIKTESLMKNFKNQEGGNDLKSTLDKNYLLSTLSNHQLQMHRKMTKTITTDYSKKERTQRAQDIPFQIITSRTNTENYQNELQHQLQKRIMLERQLELVSVQNKILKLKLQEKQQAVQKLLISNQKKQQINDKLNQSLRNEHLQSQFYVQRIEILENCSKKYQSQLQQWVDREKDLRDTIKFNHETISKLQEEKQILQQKLTKTHKESQQTAKQMQSLKEQIANMRKLLRVQKEKGQIYKQKFYKSISNSNQENNSNIRNELKQTLEKHKNKIMD